MLITPIDEKAVEEGVWVEYMGVPLRIARWGNAKFSKTFRRLSKPYQREIRNNTLDNETSERLVSEAMADAILLDWDKEKFPGKVEYSKENAIELLRQDEDCREFVRNAASQAETFYRQEDEEKVESLKKPSSGTVSTAS